MRVNRSIFGGVVLIAGLIFAAAIALLIFIFVEPPNESDVDLTSEYVRARLQEIIEQAQRGDELALSEIERDPNELCESLAMEQVAQRHVEVASREPYVIPVGIGKRDDRPAAKPSRASRAADKQHDEDATQAEVKRRAKPAEVIFHVATKMSLGTTYVAKLEILREGADPKMEEVPEISTKVEILNKATASVASPFMKIDLLTPQWQEIAPRNRGYWYWAIEPQRAGKAELLVTVQHAGIFQGQERAWNVEHFPRTVEIEVSLWHATKMLLAGMPPVITAAAALLTAVGTVAASACGAWVWLRNRRRKCPARLTLNHEGYLPPELWRRS